MKFLFCGSAGFPRVATLGVDSTKVGGLRLTVASSGSNALKGDEYRSPFIPMRIGRSPGSDTVKQWCKRSILPWVDEPGNRIKLCGRVAILSTSLSSSWLSAWVIVS